MNPDSESHPFEAYVSVRGPSLLRFGYVLTGDRQQSEDLVQEALTRVYRRWTRIASLEHPDAYVRRVMVNDFLSWRRRRASRLVYVADPPDTRSPAGYGSDPATAHADRDAMWQLLAQLPRQQRAVLVLRYYEGWTDEQIAPLVHCSAVTVRAHASKALARLRSAATTNSILNGAD